MTDTRVCMVVDDSRVVRKVARGMLEKSGFTVLEAEHGKDALNVYKQQQGVELILLDHNMPEMDGMEFLKTLRGLDGGDKPVVIFCTTENDLSFIQEAIKNGANEFVMKPFDQGIIDGKLKEVGLI